MSAADICEPRYLVEHVSAAHPKKKLFEASGKNYGTSHVLAAQTILDDMRDTTSADALRLVLYQHAVLENPQQPDFKNVFCAKFLDTFSNLIVSAPFFHASPLSCMKDNPIAKLLSKTVPNRCQVRSLVDIVSTTIHTHPEVNRFMEFTMKCSLMGLFPGSRPARLAARKNILEKFHIQKDEANASFTSNHEDDSIISCLLRQECYHTLFFALKEVLVYLVNVCCPAVKKVLEEKHGWSDFCRLLRHSMDRSRQTLTGDSGDFDRFEQSISSVSKQKIRRLFSKQTIDRDFEKELNLECQKKFKITSVADRSSHWDDLHELAVHGDKTEFPVDWLPYLAWREGDTPQQIARRHERLCDIATGLEKARKAFYNDGSKAKIRSVVSKYDWDDTLVEVASLAELFKQKKTTYWIKLPYRVTIQQIRALRRVYGVKDGTSMSKCPHYMGKAALCEACGTFKSFLTPKSGKSSTNRLIAFGFKGALVDDDDLGTFYCGRKVVATGRNSNKSKASGKRSVKTGRALRHSKFFGTRCNNTKLTIVSLVGRMLCFREKMYAICCFCGNFHRFTGDSWHGDSLCCMRCIDPVTGQKIYENSPCDWCENVVPNTHLTDIWTTDAAVDQEGNPSSLKQKKRLCKKCVKPAFTNAKPYSLSWGEDICNALAGCQHKKLKRK